MHMVVTLCFNSNFTTPLNAQKKNHSFQLFFWKFLSAYKYEYLNGKRPFDPTQREFAAFFAAEDIKGTHFNTTD